MQVRLTVTDIQFKCSKAIEHAVHSSDTKRGFDSSLNKGPHGIGGGATHSSG